MEEVLRAIRGATTVDEDTPDQVRERTQELVREMLDRNEVAIEDLVSIFFTSTEDLTSSFPATAARALGLQEVPLLSAREISVPGALGNCVRVLMHCYTTCARKEIRHVFLEKAVALRPDLAE